MFEKSNILRQFLTDYEHFTTLHEVVLDAILTYQLQKEILLLTRKSDLNRSDSLNRIEPLYLSLGSHSNEANEIHAAIKKAYPQEVISVGFTLKYLQHKKLDFGQFTTDKTLHKEVVKDKVVIFESAEKWFSDETKALVRTWVEKEIPLNIIFLGS